MFTRHLIREYGGKDTRNQYNAYKGSLSFIQRLQIERRLEVHSGCVNTICWNDRGTNILSGSDDLHLVVSNPYNGKIIHKIRSGHRQNIFSAKYLANGLDNETISCSGDGKIFYTHLEREDLANAHMFDCHFGTTYEVLVIPNEASTFLSCGEDGTVRFFDLREKSSCSKPSCKEDVMITCRSAITAMAANPLHPWQLGVGCSDSSVRIYDRRMLGTRATGNYSGKSLKGLLSMFTPPSLEKESYRVTSLHYSSDGRDVLDCDDFKPLVKEVPEIKSSGVPATESSDEPSPGQSSASDGVALPTNDTETRQPPVKRLRLRGDWSDTGPGARPERQTPGGTTSEAGQEHQEATGSARSRVMNRMSDLLTRWLVTNMRSTQAQRDSQTTEGGGEQGAQELVGADRGATEGSLEGASEGDQPASDNNHEPVQEIHEFSEETQAMLTEMGRDIPRN
ncbi:DCAF6-like protein, partial [Mya arenaria]